MTIDKDRVKFKARLDRLRKAATLCATRETRTREALSEYLMSANPNLILTMLDCIEPLLAVTEEPKDLESCLLDLVELAREISETDEDIAPETLWRYFRACNPDLVLALATIASGVAHAKASPA